MKSGGWAILTGNEAFDYIEEKTNLDLKAWLIELEEQNTYKIDRDEN